MADDESMHADTALVGSDGVPVLVHGAMLRARCPRLADRAAPPQRATKRSRTSKIASGKRINPTLATVSVNESTGATLRHLSEFLYTDALPLNWIDEGVYNNNQSLSESISLMATARDLCPLWSRSSSSTSSSSSFAVAPVALSSRAGTPSMRRLQTLCEAHVASHISLVNVPSSLARALDGNLDYIQHVCYQLLARDKPIANLQFSENLIGALSAYPQALAIAMAAASGVYQPPQPAESIETPDSTFVSDMELLFSYANSAQTSSKSTEESTYCLAPDCSLVSGALSFGAHRFVLAARSDYFKAAFCGDGGGFAEGSSAAITLTHIPIKHTKIV